MIRGRLTLRKKKKKKIIGRPIKWIRGFWCSCPTHLGMHGSNRIQVIGHNRIGCKSLTCTRSVIYQKRKLVMHAPKMVVRVFISEKLSTN